MYQFTAKLLSSLSSGHLAFDAIQLFLLVAFLAAMGLLPSGYWRIGKIRIDKKVKKTLKDIASKQEQLELEGIASATRGLLVDKPAKESYFTKKLFASIDYAIKRHDWYEEQRARIFHIAMTLLSAVLTILAIISRSSLPSDPRARIVITAIGFIALLSLLRLVFLYNKDLDADRPYRLISDIRFWYFRYNLPDKSQGSVNKKKALGLASAVAQERARFANRILENFEIGKSIREDLEQIFILQALQRYKSESLVRMRWVLSYFLIFGSIQVFLLALVSMFR